MSVYAIRPKWEIWVYAYAPGSGKDPLPWQSSLEQKISLSPYKLPEGIVESFQFTDNIEGSSFSVTIPNGGQIQITKDFQLYDLLDEGNIVCIKDDGKIVFSGYITQVQDQDNIRGLSTLVISGGGLEQAIKEQTIFIDFTGRLSDRNLRRIVKNSGNTSIKNAFDIATSTAKDVKKPGKAVHALIDSALSKLLESGTFGGSQYKELLSLSGISKYSYTENFIHAINFINHVKFGNTISIWSLADTFAKRPLYDLFVHYNEYQPFYVDPDITLEEKTKPALGTLVYRKTPWYLFETYGYFDKSRGVYSEIPDSIIESINLRSSMKDIFTGVTIEPGFIKNRSTATAIVPVIYNLALKGKFGQRVLTIKLDGVTLDESYINRNRNKKAFDKLNEEFYKYFGQGERIVSGSISCNYYRYVTPGQIIKILPSEKNGKLHKGLQKYGSEFFCNGRTVSVDIQSGVANMELDVKWGKKNRETYDTVNASTENIDSTSLQA